MELAMDITADDHWSSHWLHVGLLDEDLLGLLAQLLHLSLRQWFAFEKLGDLPVQISVIKPTFHLIFKYAETEDSPKPI